MSERGWIGVDFDGTLATYDSGQWPAVGDPIMPMVYRVNQWLAEGKEVRIVTARAGCAADVQRVYEFCVNHFGRKLHITSQKDHSMVELWDDRAIQVERNTGRRVDGQP